MATNKPRVYVTLDRDLYEFAQQAAKEKEISLSLFLRDKLRDAIEWQDTFEIIKDNEALKTIQQSLNELKKGEEGVPWREII